MSNISPQTQAVRDAAEKQTDLDFRYAPQIAAAALRALVKACSFEDFNHQLISVSDVIAIANELDTL